MKRGFSLVEFMVVVAIVGILAAILIPAVMEAQKNRNKKSVPVREMNNLNQGSTTVYYTDQIQEFISNNPNKKIIQIVKDGGSIIILWEKIEIPSVEVPSVEVKAEKE